MGHNNIPLFARKCNRKTSFVRQKQADGSQKLHVKEKVLIPTKQFESNAEHSYSIQSNANCENCSELIAKIEQLEEQLGKYKGLLHQCVKRPFTVDSFASDKKINSYTGIKDLFTFEFLYSKLHLKAKLMRHWSGPSKCVMNKMLKNPRGKKPGVKRSLSLKDEFFITLMRIRTGASCEMIGDMFGVSKSCVSRICKDVRHIIDCTEFFIETPTGLKMKRQFWSPYKNHYTT